MVRVYLNCKPQDNAIAALLRAKDDHEIETISIRYGAIGFAVASTVRELLSSDPFDRVWKIEFIACHPENIESSRELKAAFSNKIKTVYVRGADHDGAQNENDAMLSALFQPKSHGNYFKHLENIYFSFLELGEDAISTIRSTLERSPSLHHLSIDFCEFIPAHEKDHPFERMFSGLNHRPSSLKISAVGICKFGDRKPLSNIAAWEGLRKLECVCSDDCLPDFTSFSKLDSLYIHREEHPSDLIASNLIQLLESPECKLTYLELQTDVNDAYQENLLRAFVNNSSVKKLRIRSMDLEVCMRILLDVLTSNTTLRLFDCSTRLPPPKENAGPTESSTKLFSILENQNSTFEAFYPADDELMHYLARNWAGRRIISRQQNSIPLGLWPIILGRISGLNEYTVGRVNYGFPSEFYVHMPLRVDSMFHLLRNSDIGYILGGASRDEGKLAGSSVDIERLSDE